jgi:hypothetical protein
MKNCKLAIRLWNTWSYKDCRLLSETAAKLIQFAECASRMSHVPSSVDQHSWTAQFGLPGDFQTKIVHMSFVSMAGDYGLPDC